MESLAIIIPARFASTRFPGKVLHPLLGKPLVLWVVEGALQSGFASRVIVATDDEKIERIVTESGHEAFLTREDHPSGTDRVWEVAETLDEKWIMNLQGDEPLITGEVIDSLASVAMFGSGEIEIATLVRNLDPSEAGDPNRVKVVVNRGGDALYFSRARIPFPNKIEDESMENTAYLLHVGVYLYRRDILEKFVAMEQGFLEKFESLEQLRPLENGISIRCVKTSHEFLGVDTLSDVSRVEQALRGR